LRVVYGVFLPVASGAAVAVGSVLTLDEGEELSAPGTPLEGFSFSFLSLLSRFHQGILKKRWLSRRARLHTLTECSSSCIGRTGTGSLTRSGRLTANMGAHYLLAHWPFAPERGGGERMRGVPVWAHLPAKGGHSNKRAHWEFTRAPNFRLLKAHKVHCSPGFFSCFT